MSWHRNLRGLGVEAPMVVGYYKVRTNGGNLNVKQSPSDTSAIVGTLSNGFSGQVIALSDDKKWASIMGGWISMDYIDYTSIVDQAKIDEQNAIAISKGNGSQPSSTSYDTSLFKPKQQSSGGGNPGGQMLLQKKDNTGMIVGIGAVTLMGLFGAYIVSQVLRREE